MWKFWFLLICEFIILFCLFLSIIKRVIIELKQFLTQKFIFRRTIELCSEENPNRLMAGHGASTRMSMKAKVWNYLQQIKKWSFRYQRWSNFGVLKRRLPTSIERSLHLQLLTMQLFLLDEIDNFTRPTIISGRVHTSPSTKLQQHDSIDDSHRK